MNLVEVEIENYRQFSGLHRFTPSDNAMTAIIGENGAGKTTLFESIEWCLYNPTSIKTADIRNRVFPGHPRVKVALENPATGEQFEIEREARKSSTNAAIYRSDQPATPLVQGSRQVTDFVARNLVGLNHKAFVATIFTRQKELSFFGSYSRTDRRREVGKLLGLETIRRAQESIAAQRLQKRSEANSKSNFAEAQFAEIDFDASLAQIATKIQQHSLDAGLQETALQAANDGLAIARKAVERVRERQARFAKLELQMATLDGNRRTFDSKIETSQKALDDLNELEKRVQELQPLAQKEPTLASRVEKHVQQLEKHRAIAESKRRQQALGVEQARLEAMVMEIGGILGDDSIAPSISEDNGEARIGRRLESCKLIASQADPSRAEMQLRQLERCITANTTLQRSSDTLQRYQQKAEQIRSDLSQLLSGEDPTLMLERYRTERATAQQTTLTLEAELKRTNADLKRTRDLRKRLELDASAERCPTCDRPFADGELDGYLSTLSRQTDDLNQQTERIQREMQKAEKHRLQVVEHEKKATEAKTTIDTLKQRLANSEAPLQETRELVAADEAALKEALAIAGKTTVPSDTELRTVESQIIAERNQAAQLSRLNDIDSGLGRIASEKAEISQALEDLGPDLYSKKIHEEDDRKWKTSRDASTQVITYLERIARRPSIQSELASAQSERQAISLEVHQVNAQIVEHGFDQAEVKAAAEDETRRLNERDEALSAKNRAVRALEASQSDEQQLIERKTQLERYREEAERALQSAEQLDRMYSEFNKFEQFVAQSLTPALSELTSQLVSEVTEGKYDRVEFTEDFGVMLFDGNDDAFPLEQFSGGERDVVSLCARLALSQLIGGQAEHPLQFVVLDEVFGSLDRSRRQNLMEMLQQLVQDSGPFRQLFAISHVDDIQHSPAFDDAWKIIEQADGISQLEQFSSVSLPAD